VRRSGVVAPSDGQARARLALCVRRLSYDDGWGHRAIFHPMPKLRRSTYIVLSLVTLIVIAHVFLWLSDMPTGQKLMWTALNTVAWTIILAPVFLVDRWLDALRQRNSGDRLE
jgi:hypothetical protein